MDDEEFCVPDDVLEEASAAKYQMVPTKSKLRYQKELEIFTQWQTEIKGKDESSISAVVLKSTLFVFQNVDISRYPEVFLISY
jgi:CRISPR/Cas system-associated protein Cas10 (large subunit of type III CRISPR-Cas system)